ncbi:MAG: carbohydrate kinase family protein [Spirochaetia bacterium]|nr:carbohydrate kinase family protein [Spirochaetia bacterium]MBR4796137.1 carbohydrate kinase family protein [Spirochaetia bacterium]MBR5016253.1 carbohydrate kinase family protein [Spirochaetia bacterium]
MKIVTVGTVYVDIKGYPEGQFFPTGRNAGDIKYFHGGVARNIAEDVAKLGEDSILVSLVDDSGVAADVIRYLKAVNVETNYVKATKKGMGTWMAVFDNKGELCASISKRPELLPICDILASDEEQIFKDAAGILLEIDIDEQIVDLTMRLAEKYDIPVYAVISNMTIAKERINYIKKTTCFFCNRLEAGIFFDKKTLALSPQEMLDMLKLELKKMKMQAMVITMDSDGAVYATAKGEAGLCPALPITVVDTTGAGDAFFAGTSVGLLRRLSLAEACALGTEAAASVLSTKENVLK